ncbi:MAG: dihydropteroate synthase-like protein [Candidatus Jordarchaeales archaeon]
MLFVTGRLAEGQVRKYAESLEIEVDVVSLPVSVAALITPQMLVEHLKGVVSREKYDAIIVPGLLRGDVSAVEEQLGVPVFKGPRYACDIPLILKNFASLSKEEALDVVLARLRDEAWSKLGELTEGFHLGFTIGRVDVEPVYVGVDGPVRVLAEVVDAPELPLSKVIARTEYFLESGADMIDIGAIVGKDNSRKISDLVHVVREKFRVPVSVDSLNPAEIEAAVEAGADMVLSLDYGNFEEVKLPSDVAVTILPTNVKKGEIPRSPEERARKTLELVKEVRGAGLVKVLADPLLEPPINPGIANSLRSYFFFRDMDEVTPLLFGAGNVTEFIDADSVGVNVFLALLAQELGVAVLLTTENSVKSRGCVREVAAARKLAYMAKALSTPPKDLGVDVFVAKSKKEYFEPPDTEGMRVISEVKVDDYSPDPLGYFTIWVSHDDGRIFTLYRGVKGEMLFAGRSAEHIGKAILSEGLVGSLEHAIYLGRELEKAEVCLKLGKSYVQDVDVFGGWHE